MRRQVLVLFYQRSGDIITVSGRTYPYRDAIKGLGGRFRGDAKVWAIPYSDHGWSEIDKLCNQVGGHKLDDSSLSPEHPPLPALPIIDAPGDTASPSQGISVSDLVQQVADVIQGRFQNPVWVVGEVQNLSSRKQATYLNLAEAPDPNGTTQNTVSVSAVLWQSNRKALATKVGEDKLEGILQDGMSVLCQCRISLYKGRGSLSLTILDIDPNYSLGKLALQRQKLLAELRAKGLDQANKQRPLMAIPLKIGLITAEGSRAYSDFVHQLEQGGYSGEVWYAPAASQGDGVLTEVPRAIAALVAKRVDMIVITRGGGSAADLRWFDSGEVAYAISQAPVPIIAAIGHHEDVCVAEEISFLRCKTPTAAAEAILQIFSQVREKLRESQLGLDRYLRLCLDRNIQHQERLAQAFSHAVGAAVRRGRDVLFLYLQSLSKSVASAVHLKYGRLQTGQVKILSAAAIASERHRHRLTELTQNLDGALMKQFDLRDRQLEQKLAALAAADPQKWLAKGWTQLATADGHPVSSVADIQVGDSLKVRLKDGRVDVDVTQVQEGKS